jgi:F5/8 type C domain/Secretion system C-terminal sorting domain
MKKLLHAVSMLCLLVSSCIPKSHPYPHENPTVVQQDAQRISNNLEAYIRRWLNGQVSAQIPDSLVPFEGKERKSFYLKRPQDVTNDDMWLTRYAKPVNWDSTLAGQPDPNATYYIGASPLAPFGSKLVIEGEFPYARFFSIQVTPPLNGKEYYAHPFGSAEVGIVDVDINPLPGHVNPFRVGADRMATNRKYRVEYNLAAGDPVALNGQAHVPLYRANGNVRTGALIVYRGPLGRKDAFTGDPIANPSRFNYGAIWIRTFAADKNKDARGGVALPKMWCELPTGEKYFIACDAREAKRGTDISVKMRQTKTAGLNNYFSKYAEWGKEFGLYRQILSGVCKAYDWNNPDSLRRVRETDLGATGRGEFQPPPGNYEGQATINNYCSYLSHGVPLDTNMVAVVTGQLPTFPNTRNGLTRATAAQMRYWSMGAYDNDPFGPLPGACISMVMDDELILDNNRRYIVAYSRKQDKPANATAANGIKWMEWGTIADLGLTVRWITVQPEWAFEKSPHEKNLTWAKTEFAGSAYDPKMLQNSHKGWLGCYQPKITLMTKQEFERLGNAVKADDIPVYIDPKNYLGYNDSQMQPSSASSEENGLRRSTLAFDGNLTTRWTSVWSSNPQWLSVDLGKVKKVTGVKLYWETSLKAHDYELQVSNDNINWTRIYATTTGDGGIDIVNNLKTSGRYVRVFIRAGNFPMYALMEMEVFSPDMPCSNITSVSTTPPLKNLTISPNPTTNFVNIELPSNPKEATEVVVLDIKGRVVHQKKISDKVVQIDVNSWVDGLYFVKIRTKNEELQTGKFVKN